MTTTTAISTAAEALYLSAWHGVFFSQCLHASTVAHSSFSCAAATASVRVLDLLSLVGYSTAGEWAAKLEADPAAVAVAQEELRKCQRQDHSERHQGWQQQFQLECAAVLSESGKSLLDVLAACREEEAAHLANDHIFGQLAGALLGDSKYANSPSSLPFLFGFEPGNSSSSAAQIALWREAALYSSLALSSSFVTLSPLARLLVAYVTQDDDALVTALDQAEAQAASPGNSAQVDKKGSTTEMRVRGVIAGIVAYALQSARCAPRAVAEALERLTNGEEEPGNSSSCCCAGACAVSRVSVTPAPEKQDAALVTSAALLLARFVKECGEYERAMKRTSSTPSAPSSHATPSLEVLAATEVIHVVQELLFTVVLGDGTGKAMTNRPKGANTAAAISPALSLMMITQRGLILAEADALTQTLLPALLQQLGLEWPWSETLRHCRSLDRLQQTPQPLPAGTLTPPLYVTWSSRLLMDTILLALAPRTYGERLQHCLPGSYDRLLEALDLLPAQTPQGGAEGDGGLAAATAMRQSNLFHFPAYYREVGEEVVQHLERVGLGGLRADSVEQVLRLAAGKFPMIVRLRARAPEKEGRAEHEEDEKAAEQDAVEPSAKRARHSRYPLTRERVEALEWRYLGEVLLAAIIVHTQLQVPSHVQQTVRVLAPLFVKIAMKLRELEGATGVAVSPLTMPDNQGGITQLPVFTGEAKLLMDEIGYQFYTLEWLPAVARVYHAAEMNKGKKTGSGTGLLGANMPYSVWAAVAHHMELHLQGTPLGSSGDASSRHPAGPRAGLVVPSIDGNGVSLEKGGADSAEASAAMWRRTERFLRGLLESCFLDSRSSSCDFEGMLAVVATGRAAGPALAAARDEGRTLSADAISRRIPPRVWSDFWEANSDEDTAISRDETAIRSLVKSLLSYGSSSFEGAIEAHDFMLTVLQTFLAGSTNSFAVSVGLELKASVSSARLMEAARKWCGAAAGSPADRSRVDMLLQQGGAAAPGDKAASLNALARVFNSCTFDAAPLARHVLRRVPARLLEKMKARQLQSTELTAQLRKLKMDADVTTSSSNNGLAPVDPLLAYQWSQWKDLLRIVSLLPDQGANHTELTPPPHTAEQWLWFSPYTAVEIN